MKNYFAYICLIIFISFLISGYSDSSVTTPPVNNTINVNGRTSDNFDSPVSGLSIIIGNQTVTSADDGSFTVNNVTTPYDIKMLELSAAHKYGYLYKGLTTAAPHLTISSGLANLQYSANVNITFPNGLIPAGKKVLLFYSDTTNVSFGRIINGPVN